MTRKTAVLTDERLFYTKMLDAKAEAARITTSRSGKAEWFTMRR